MNKIVLGRAAAGIYEGLLGKLHGGEWPAGTQLPTERALAEECGVARNTLRQALDRLTAEGLLERRVGQGTFVREATAPGIAGLGRLATGRHMREASPADLMEVRLIIEPQVAALAATRANAEEIARLSEALRNSLSARGLAEFEYWDAKLHLAVFEAARNGVLIDYCLAINAVRDEPAWYQLKKRSVTAETRARYDTQHSDLVAAIRDHDGERARAAMRAHLITVRGNLLGED
ncbi:FadR family transcriptional regulator [Marivibrio halodurans]|uniref:FadR family transcriptional regulator n=1 Tax=Marivibrio halodurans TaxID=2039722 RepID=A0A8J7V3H1_9PROT|nr:GntR family transcriptional regulator [Marivibrio halodurans]MBP5858345.1 FadR family transcriptional regulator [Marivibrio halodurans]